MLHHGWDHVEAKLVDQRFVKRTTSDVQRRIYYQVWEYMVEFADRGSDPVRLAITEESFKVRLPSIGGTVPILVNPKRTKAVFDLKDPRINATKAREAEETAAKAADRARFEAELSGRSGDTGTAEAQALAEGLSPEVAAAAAEDPELAALLEQEARERGADESGASRGG